MPARCSWPKTWGATSPASRFRRGGSASANGCSNGRGGGLPSLPSSPSVPWPLWAWGSAAGGRRCNCPPPPSAKARNASSPRIISPRPSMPSSACSTMWPPWTWPRSPRWKRSARNSSFKPRNSTINSCKIRAAIPRCNTLLAGLLAGWATSRKCSRSTPPQKSLTTRPGLS